MKKFKSNLQIVSNILTTIGIPLLFIYGFQIHNEQIRMKDQKIETLEAFKETLEYNQINSAMERFNSLKEHNQDVINDLNSKKKDNDSLNNIIKKYGLNLENKVICLDRNQSIAIVQGLVELEYTKKEVKIYKNSDSIRNINDLKISKHINEMMHQIKLRDELIKLYEIKK